MSRGLGEWQRRFLAALHSLEQEHAPGDQFYIWAVCQRLYDQSPDLQAMDAAIDADVDARREARVALAATGDEWARQMIMLESLIAGHRRQEGRPAVRDKIGHMDSVVNSTRIARSLAKRGLIIRDARPGYGVVSLTERGREQAISV